MLSTALGIGLLLTLAIVILPAPRVRRLLLTAAARIGQAVVLAFLGACGTFFAQPQKAPDWLTAAIHPLLEGTLGWLPDTANAVPSWSWLALAVLTVGISLPVLIVVELAISLSKTTALVQASRRDSRPAAWGDGRLAALGVPGMSYPALPNEAAAAAEALRSANHPNNPTLTAPAPLVFDLLK